jgi:hypothetical protein
MLSIFYVILNFFYTLISNRILHKSYINYKNFTPKQKQDFNNKTKNKIDSLSVEFTVFKNEIDVLILPHHGADNGFITGDLLDQIKPKIAICSSNHGNQYRHPKEKIRSLLSNRSIPLLTTKEGDIIIEHVKGGIHTSARNFVSNNTGLQGTHVFVSKRYH